jgi:hypothetical protein
MNNAESFWSRVNTQPTARGCWIWTGKPAKKTGYGQISIAGVPYIAHRLAYELERGPIPEGLQVRHCCDVRLCCNPAHLLLGSHQDNMDDRRARGRTAIGDRTLARKHPERLARGERHGNTTLTSGDVLAIRGSILSQKALSLKYGVTQASISGIILRRTWKHI